MTRTPVRAELPQPADRQLRLPGLVASLAALPQRTTKAFALGKWTSRLGTADASTKRLRMGHADRSCSQAPLEEAPVSSVPISQEVVRPPCVMLVGMEPCDVAKELALDRAFVQVVRVRRALLACARMAGLLPEVVLAGPTVTALDYVLLRRAATLIDSTIVQLGPLMVRQLGAGWLMDEIESVRIRRSHTKGEGRSGAAR